MFQTISYLDDKGELREGYRPTLDKENLIKAYRVMMQSRLIDERMINLQRQGAISFALSCCGEEACAAGGAAALELEDWIYPQYRENGVMFWRGFTILQYVHNMFGTKEDLNFGRQMPNHYGSRVLNVVTVSSPIATKIPHAAGCAYAMKLANEKAVTVCYFGEGATSEGDFHAGLNFAAVRKAPAIFFCRNNGYAISTPYWRQYASDGVAPKGVGYGMTAFRIDGNDFFAVYETVKKARQLCLEGKGPILIEAMTYRMCGHSTSDDPTLYRKDAEVDEWKMKCPILRLGTYLRKQGLWDETIEKELIDKINYEINQAIAIAKDTEKPSLKYIVEHVYSEVPESLKKQYEELVKGL